jgi:hypothetical protein
MRSILRGRAAGQEKLLALARQLPTDFLDIQAQVFRVICELHGR